MAKPITISRHGTHHYSLDQSAFTWVRWVNVDTRTKSRLFYTNEEELLMCRQASVFATSMLLALQKYQATSSHQEFITIKFTTEVMFTDSHKPVLTVVPITIQLTVFWVLWQCPGSTLTVISFTNPQCKLVPQSGWCQNTHHVYFPTYHSPICSSIWSALCQFL